MFEYFIELFDRGFLKASHLSTGFSMGWLEWVVGRKWMMLGQIGDQLGFFFVILGSSKRILICKICFFFSFLLKCDTVIRFLFCCLRYSVESSVP